jgi:hypothetical protein
MSRRGLRPARWPGVSAGLLLAGLGACQPVAAPDPAADTGRPMALAGAKVVSGGAICPLESVNGEDIRQKRSFAAASRATLVGWSTVADKARPVPPMATIVLRSVVPDGSRDLFWPGIRVARPDLSSDPRLLASGYSASGVLPQNPGRYKVLVWVGDARLQHECDTLRVLEVRG